jgi:hypothetical protein
VPFTLSHPAAVLPLVRAPFVPAALVAGAVAPDVPYFVRVPRSANAWYEPFVNATTTHEPLGALAVAVPTAAVLLALWSVVRAPLRALAVGHERGDVRRLPRSGSWGVRACWVVVSLVLGVATHVVWDALTDDAGFLVELLVPSREPEAMGWDGSRVLQHASTALGLGVLGVWSWRRFAAWRGDGGRLRLTSGRAAVVAGIVALVVGVTVAAAVRAGQDELAGVEGVLTAVAKAAGSTFAAAVLVYAVAWWCWAGRRRSATIIGTQP